LNPKLQEVIQSIDFTYRYKLFPLYNKYLHTREVCSLNDPFHSQPPICIGPTYPYGTDYSGMKALGRAATFNGGNVSLDMQTLA